TISKEEEYRKFDLDPDKTIIVLMPGSRRKEINRLLSVMLESAKIIKSKFPDCQFILPVAQTISRDMLPDMQNLPVTIIDGSDVYDMMNITDLIIMASGTATLEATFMLAPMIVIYKVSGISWAVMSRMANPNVKSTTLPNIIADKMIVPELLQDKANPNNISQIAIKMLSNSQELEKQRDELRKVREKMGEAGAVERVAKLVLGFINLSTSL
ncbi:TPA: lipid-A-disaccharide synthase, partial [bacterium]|nr:lipid-A-disaccharide synthase [bacterium]